MVRGGDEAHKDMTQVALDGLMASEWGPMLSETSFGPPFHCYGQFSAAPRWLKACRLPLDHDTLEFDLTLTECVLQEALPIGMRW
mmetsp:Transcript_34862/g.63683  ORF Transcript_34862/g.63683 Transcript_34862/m.63683 type:complete len:85 (+) Transcript_34862:2621-2875(+)